MTSSLATWRQFEQEAPDLAAAVRDRIEFTKHHVLATLRRDGSPRVSGTEVLFFGDDLVLGSMVDSRKANDLQRDGRFAFHTNPGDSTMQGGDAKVSGQARLVTDSADIARFVDEVHPPEPFLLFELGLGQIVLTSLHSDGDRIVIETWHPGESVRRVERS